MPKNSVQSVYRRASVQVSTDAIVKVAKSRQTCHNRFEGTAQTASGLDQTLLHALKEDVFGQIDPDKYHFVGPLLVGPPGRTQIASHELVNALKNDFTVGTLHVQNTLVPKHSGAVDVDDGTQEIFQFGRIKRSV